MYCRRLSYAVGSGYFAACLQQCVEFRVRSATPPRSNLPMTRRWCLVKSHCSAVCDCEESRLDSKSAVFGRLPVIAPVSVTAIGRSVTWTGGLCLRLDWRYVTETGLEVWDWILRQWRPAGCECDKRVERGNAGLLSLPRRCPLRSVRPCTNYGLYLSVVCR